MSVADFFAIDPLDKLRDDIIAMIIARHTATPRHQQVALGPSEIGHPCPRKLALAMTNQRGVNAQWDPLPSIIGTAVHTWLQTAAELANAELQRERWIAEKKVHVTDWLSGSCDLYDTDSDTVVDYKVPGVNQFNILRKEMTPVYRAQVHMYGLGFVRAGYPVKTVAIMLIPRGGQLSTAKLWHEPYNQRLAEVTITNYERLETLVREFDVVNHPERYEWFAKDGYQCMFCPWFTPMPQGPLECEGDETPGWPRDLDTT